MDFFGPPTCPAADHLCQVQVMIGGTPVTQRYAGEIGADGYAPDAASAVDLARELVKS